MEDTKTSLAALELLENPLMASTANSEALNQQLLYMNNLLALNSAVNPTALSVRQVSKEQISEYQLARMQFHQQLIAQSNLYNTQACNYGQYSDIVKSNASNYARIEQPRYRYLQEEPKPQHSYIGLIAMAILSMPEQKMVLSDIYQYILDHYPYFRNRGPGWRNSIRHNLSLNDCFIKAGRSANGKGHYWAIHPANLDDFKKGDFRRRKAQRKVRKHMGLSVPDDEEDEDSPVPSPLAVMDKSTCNGGLVVPPSTHYPITAPVNSAAAMLTPATSLLTQQAFNLFNSLRFTLPTNYPLKPPSNSFNETLYKHLIDLNIRRDLQSISRPNNRTQFSIESLLAHHDKPSESESDCEPHCKRKRVSPDTESYQSSSSAPLLSTDWCVSNLLEHSTDSPNSQPVNLKIN